MEISFTLFKESLWIPLRDKLTAEAIMHAMELLLNRSPQYRMKWIQLSEDEIHIIFYEGCVPPAELIDEELSKAFG